MKDVKNVMPEETVKADGVSRRRFLGYAGGLAGAGLLIGSCKKEDSTPTEPGTTDLGINDNGLLNLMFVTQQIEAAFYQQLVTMPYGGISAEESKLFADMLDHEIAHREYLRNYLKGNGTVIATDFSIIDFSARSKVLEHAELIENLVVASFNEIARLMVSAEHAGMVIKMASLEARHAGTVSNMRTKGSYFGTVDVTGSEQGMLPSNCITIINRFLSTKVSGNNLPNK